MALSPVMIVFAGVLNARVAFSLMSAAERVAAKRGAPVQLAPGTRAEWQEIVS